MASLFRDIDAYPHGSRSRYRLGCRCLPCTQANRDYARRRALERAKGRDNPLIDAAPLRAQLTAWEAKGVTPNRIGHLAGVSWVQLYRIKHGQQRHVRRQTANRVMAVTPTALDAFALVPSYHSRQLVHALRSEDFPPARIAQALRLRSARVRLQARRITVRNALRIRGLYRYLMGED